MAEYQLQQNDVVLRVEDNVYIPPDPANRDYAEYLQWVEDGGVPDPYVPPPEVEPVPTPEQEMLFEHENRIRAIEGAPPLTQDEFKAKAAPA